MRLVLTVLVVLAGLFFFATGANFLINPASAAAEFGLTPQGTAGLASIRADIGTFFLLSAVCMLLGAWRRNRDLLLVAAGFYAVALLGRLITVIIDGTTEGFWIPMAIEAVVTAILLIASRVLPLGTVPETD